jgi:hypothetical protein
MNAGAFYALVEPLRLCVKFLKKRLTVWCDEKQTPY